MPGNNREDCDTTYSEMCLSTEALEDLNCLLTHTQKICRRSCFCWPR